MSYSRCKKSVNVGIFFWILGFMCVRAMRPRDPVLNVGQNNKININIPVGTDQLNVAINRVSSSSAVCRAPLGVDRNRELENSGSMKYCKAGGRCVMVACRASNEPS